MTAIYESLVQQLQSDNPTSRIQALQILAMVEETRAIDDVLALYKTDPDDLVRKTAQWAGNLIWAAQQRGHSIETMLNADSPVSTDTRMAVYDPSRDYKEKRILDSLMAVPTAREHDMQNQQDLLRAEWERLNAVSAKRKTSTLPAATDPIIADFDLLNSGLSPDFRRYLEERE